MIRSLIRTRRKTDSLKTLVHKNNIKRYFFLLFFFKCLLLEIECHHHCHRQGQGGCPVALVQEREPILGFPPLVPVLFRF